MDRFSMTSPFKPIGNPVQRFELLDAYGARQL